MPTPSLWQSCTTSFLSHTFKVLLAILRTRNVSKINGHYVECCVKLLFSSFAYTVVTDHKILTALGMHLVSKHVHCIFGSQALWALVSLHPMDDMGSLDFAMKVHFVPSLQTRLHWPEWPIPVSGSRCQSRSLADWLLCWTAWQAKKGNSEHLLDLNILYNPKVECQNAW